MDYFDVYGIGNALVDMVFEVDQSYLTKMSIVKGVMTLVDEKRQDDLLAAVTGEQLTRCCGGSAANSLIAVAQLGGNGFYSCKVANDETGDFYWRDLVASGLKSNLASARPDGVTGKCMVFVTPDADRTMNTFLGITEKFSVEELIEDEIAKAKYLYIEGYLVTSDTGRVAALEAYKMAKKHNVKTALTFSDPAMVQFFREGLDSMIGDGVDLLFCNEEEAYAYTETKDLKEATEKLKPMAKTFAITLGERGALVFDGNELIEIAGRKVDALDSNGAGDLFAGAFLYGVTNGYSFKESGDLACAASAQLVTQYGARLRTAQLKKIKKEILN